MLLDKNSFSENLHALCPTAKEKKFLLTASGGADSMVLVNLFLSLNLKFEIAHVNYHLRGQDSILDQQLVENFAKKHQIKLHKYNVTEADQKPENSIELWAREIRYRFFFSLLKEDKIDYLVTGHHLNDQLETFLINLSKASGIVGLSGIPENENRIIRPLLHFTKKNIYDYALLHNIEFREDKSNFTKDYLRNRIRLDITPELEKTNKDFWKNFDKSLKYLNETKIFVQSQISKIIDDISIQRNNEELIISKVKLFEQTNFVQYEILKKLGFVNEKEQKKISSAKSGSVFKGNEKYLIIYRDQLIITNEINEGSQDEIILPFNKSISSPIDIMISDNEQKIKNNCWTVDKNKVRLPLKIRHAKKGDLFYPIGMIGKKLISKFFKDEKISILARQKTWLLLDSDNQILGVIGKRQDGRFVAKEKESKLFIYL